MIPDRKMGNKDLSLLICNMHRNTLQYRLQNNFPMNLIDLMRSMNQY